MAKLEDRINEYIKARGLDELFEGKTLAEKYEAITGIVNPGALIEEDKEGWHVPGGFATSVSSDSESEEIDDSSSDDDGSDDYDGGDNSQITPQI